MDFPSDWMALLVLAFLLGAKHGFDADHLATIDGLTRHNLRHIPGRARWCGSLFSLGHGTVVTVISLGAGIASSHWQVPQCMEDIGTWISISFLTLLGILNVRSVLMTAPGTLVTTIGLKAGILSPLQSTSQPLAIVAVGALFALSFDTMSQAIFLAVAAARHGGPAYALILGLMFTAGMLLTDGINGLWIARLLCRADNLACVASRMMGLMVAAVSFAAAAFGLLRWARADISSWYEGKELGIGVSVILLLTINYVLAQNLARPPLAVDAGAQEKPPFCSS